MSSLPPHLDQVMRDRITTGLMEIAESMRPLEEAAERLQAALPPDERTDL